MKIMLLGIAIILFSIGLMEAYSSDGLANSSGTTFGLVILFIGLFVTIIGIFIKDKK